MSELRKINLNPQRMNLLKEGLKKSGKTIMSSIGKDVFLGRTDKERLRKKIRTLVMGLSKELLAEKYRKDVKEEIIIELMNSLEEEKSNYPQLIHEQLREYCESQIEEILGFGAIQPYINDPEVSDIMVNGAGRGNVFIEKGGRLIQAEEYYTDSEQIMNVIEMIVGPVGRVIDESNPMVDARLSDGSRFNAIIPPLALNGPGFSIRKFHASVSLEDLVDNYRTLTWEVVEILKAFVVARFNIIASGGTGSGKTTMLNTLSEFIPQDERVITIEDAAELRFTKPNMVRWETRKANAEGKGEITIRQLVKNALRARPDRIVIGEVRGEEALDMLQAMNTGHNGSLTTGHANSARDMISRLETMVLMSGMELPVRAIKEQISSAIDIILHTRRLKDGRRRVEEICVIEGIDGDNIITSSFMKHDYHKDILATTGRIPDVLNRLNEVNLDAYNIKLPEWLAREVSRQ